jgi:hypothetical protein
MGRVCGREDGDGDGCGCRDVDVDVVYKMDVDVRGADGWVDAMGMGWPMGWEGVEERVEERVDVSTPSWDRWKPPLG